MQGPDTNRASLDEIRANLEGQQPLRLRVLNYRKDGTQYWSELSIRPLIDASGRCTHLISVQRDVTDQQRNEQELQRLNQRLARRLQRLTALRSDRPYRQSWSEERVIERIRLGSGSYFDPRVVAAFLEMLSPSIATD